jgi:hypothetical protein
MDDRNAPATKGDIADILEAVRDVETKLLNAFYGHARSNDQRVPETGAKQRLNMPPQQ